MAQYNHKGPYKLGAKQDLESPRDGAWGALRYDASSELGKITTAWSSWKRQGTDVLSAPRRASSMHTAAEPGRPIGTMISRAVR